MGKVKLLLIGVQGYSSDELDLPLGLMYLSSYLKAHVNECEIKVINSSVDFKGEDELLEIVRKFKPDIVGFRGISIYLDELLKCATKIKKDALIDCTILVGGPAANADTECLVRSNLFDNIVVGEGEQILLNIVTSYLQNKKLMPNIHENSKNPHDTLVQQGFIETINDLPFPDYSVINFTEYRKMRGFNYKNNKHASIFTSRGCPYRCIYCHSIFGKKARLRSVENVMDEIRFLSNTYGIKYINIMDDIFNIDYDRAIRIFDSIIKEKLGLKLFFPNGIRGDIIDETFIDYMVEAGTKLVTFAVETASPRLQGLIRKNLNLGKLTENIIYACKKDILVHAFFMIGFPSETVDEAISTLAYVDQIKQLTMPILNFVRYYEGTELYELAREYGFTEVMLKNNGENLYYDPQNFCTPLLTNQNIKELSKYFVYNIVSHKERVDNALRVLHIHLDEQEIMDYLNYFHPYKSNTIAEFTKKIAIVNRAYNKGTNLFQRQDNTLTVG